MAAHPASRLFQYADRHRRALWWAVFCSVVNKIFDLAPPALIGAAVDVVVEKQDSLIARLGVTDVSHQLWLLALATVVIWGLESIFEYAYAVLWRNLAQTLQHELRLDTYDHLQRVDMGFLEDQRTGRLMSIVGDDVNQLERFLDGGANDILQLLTTVVVVGATFAVFSPTLALLAALPMPIIIYGSFHFQRRIAPRYQKVREQASLVMAQLEGNLGGMETVRSFTAEAHEFERIRGLSDGYRQANAAAISMSSAFTPLIRMAIVVGFVATLIYGGELVLSGELAVGSYSVLVFLTQRLLWPLTRLGSTVDLYQRAMASAARVLDLLDTPVEVRSGEQRLLTAHVKGEVSFEGVGFAYPGRSAVLTDFDLTIPSGKTVAIVGSTGSGKTTLVRLLLRLHDPDAGRIRLDGHDLRGLALDDLRRAVGLVSQGVFLFHGTVAENVAYGSFDATEVQITAALEVAEALEFVRALPQGLHTVIGERGQKLSGGQKQRLAIARAVLKDPPILVLDEATSAVDNETEAAIQRSLAEIGKGRTVVVVAHRLSTIRQADEIVVMSQGKVVERGVHEVLMAAGGQYARLWAVQSGDVAGL